MPLWKAIFLSILPAGLLNGILPLPLFHNGSVSRDSVPLWKALFCSTLPAGLLNGILPLPLFHNGSISRDSVPLWKALSLCTHSICLPDAIAFISFFHNGSIFRNSMPLWVRASGQSETNVKTGQRPKKADCVQNRPVSKLERKIVTKIVWRRDGEAGGKNRVAKTGSRKQGGETGWRKRDGNQNEVVAMKTGKIER